MSPGSIYVVTPISAHTKITMKRQNDILSAVFDRVGEDGMGVEDGKEGGIELYT